MRRPHAADAGMLLGTIENALKVHTVKIKTTPLLISLHLIIDLFLVLLPCPLSGPAGMSGIGMQRVVGNVGVVGGMWVVDGGVRVAQLRSMRR